MRALALSLRGIFLSFCYKFVTSVKLPCTTVTVHNFLYGKMSAIALLFQGYPPSFVKAEYLKMHARFIQSRHHPRLVLVNEIYHTVTRQSTIVVVAVVIDVILGRCAKMSVLIV